MFKCSIQVVSLAVMLSFTATTLSAQKINEPKPPNTDWARPFPPFRIAGNLFYVGTYDLACYLITTTEGNILINTGLANSGAQIKNNIETLGFRFADTKMLLTTQAHYDHTGAMAEIKKMTGAQLLADEKEEDVLVTGGSSDYELAKYGTTFKPVKPDRLLRDGDTIHLGEMHLVLLHHPGHTKGSCSYLFSVKDDRQTYRVLIANMPTIVTDKAFTDIPGYPGIAGDYAFTFQALKNVSFDIWLASHASQFNMHHKNQTGAPYNPAAFVDPAGFNAAINDLQKQYDEKMKMQ